MIGTCPDHWLHHLFLGRAYAKVGHVERALESYRSLQSLGFADNPDLTNDIGKLIMANGNPLYAWHGQTLLEFFLVVADPDSSLAMMEPAREFNPYRTGDIDIYSHLLFIMDDRVRMRKLADEIFEAGQFTATCSIALGVLVSFILFSLDIDYSLLQETFIVCLVTTRKPSSILAKPSSLTQIFTMCGH